MPNYVKNVLTFAADTPKDKVLEIQAFMFTSKDQAFDFNKLILMPTELDIEDGSRTTMGLLLCKARDGGQPLSESERVDLGRCEEYFRTLEPEAQEEILGLGRKALENLARFGHASWYGWCRAEWGTKWNACDSRANGNGFEFETAWTTPLPIFRALAKQFPDVKFTVMYADENWGRNAGTIDYPGSGDLIVTPATDYAAAVSIYTDAWGAPPPDDEDFE